MNLLDAIPAGVRVAVDSPPLIYFLDGRSELAARFAPLFEAAESGRNELVVSTIALAEVLAGPLSHGNEALAERYRKVLASSPGFSLQPVDAEVAATAARLRARYRLKLPDAIQLATAVTTGCHALVTHDRDFSRVKDVLVLGR
ncbi:MAG: type II toxin-antitoxin system VapC family toxin [Myxococcaceae bacterium]